MTTNRGKELQMNPNSPDTGNAAKLVTNAPWLLLLSAAAFAYIVQLLERIKSRKVRGWLVESLEFIVCVGIAFGTYLVSHFLRLDERLVWVASVYLGHKGTRYVFAKLDLAAAQHLSRMLKDDAPEKERGQKQRPYGEATEMP